MNTPARVFTWLAGQRVRSELCLTVLGLDNAAPFRWLSRCVAESTLDTHLRPKTTKTAEMEQHMSAALSSAPSNSALPPHTFIAQSDQQFAKVEFTSADAVHERRSKVVEWHMAKGTFKGLKALESLIFFSLVYHGQLSEHSAGLVITAHPTDLQSSVGRSRGGFYVCIAALEERGALRKWKEKGRESYTYELLLPTPPAHEQSAESAKHAGMLEHAGMLPSAPSIPEESKWRAGAQLRSGTNGAQSMPACLPGIDGALRSTPACSPGIDGALESPALMQCSNALQCNAAGEVGEEEKTRIFREEGFDVGAAIALARDRRSTADAIRIAIARADHAEKTKTLRKTRMHVISHSIRNELPPLRTPAERKRESLPDHVQEDHQRVAESMAGFEAQTRRVQALLAPVPDAELVALASKRLDELDSAGDSQRHIAVTLRMAMNRLRTSILWQAEWLRIFEPTMQQTTQI